jgi:hypothetical protein
VICVAPANTTGDIQFILSLTCWDSMSPEVRL